MRYILITGAAGYIGTVLVRQLLKKGYIVRGLDNLIFGEKFCTNHRNFEFIETSICDDDELKKSIKGMDSVVHLAAIVGDPACREKPELAEIVNWCAAKKLFDLCSESTNVKRFVFSSTCSNYGKMVGSDYVNEESPLKPLSLYARLKVRFEKYLLDSKPSNGMAATSLRFATAYGLSPHMRFDLTVNDFVRDVKMGKKLIVYEENYWRPYCHVEDLASACILVLESDKNKVAGKVFNVGDAKENYTKKMIVNEISKIAPNTKVKYSVNKNGNDPRDYRVDFTKIQMELGYYITKRLPVGLREIYNAIITWENG